LPLGEPEDMFAGAEDTGAMASDSAAAESAPTALEAGILKPKADAGRPVLPEREKTGLGVPVSESSAVRGAGPISMPAPPTGMYSGMPAEMIGEARLPELMKEPLGGRRGITGIVIMAVLLILGVGSAVIYFTVIRGADKPPGLVDAPAVLPSVPAEEAKEFVPETAPAPGEVSGGTPTTSVDEQLLFGEPVDTDGDGLDDAREGDINTDYLNWDTDGDQLSDGDEVTVWKTNPLDPDTDRDAYSDGTEVKNGYSPSGPGKIFDPALPTTTPS